MNSDLSPTARALLTLEMIQAGPGITADRLAGSLGVSERAARRYVAILREAGIPVDATRGPYGGFRLGRGARLPPLMFSGSEALALVMAVLDGHHDAADATDPVGSALGKLVRALPESVAEQIDAMRQTTSPAPDRAAARPDPDTAMSLVRACSARRLVRIDYRSEAGSQWQSDVQPWAVVVRHGRWYLLCGTAPLPPDAAPGRVRAYRIDRVRSVALLDERFDPPADLDPVAMLEDHLAVGWEYETDVLVDASLDRTRRWLPRALGRLESIDPATTRLIGTTSNPIWYAEQLAVVPAPFRIVGGPELRECAARLARRMLAAVGSDDAATEALRV